MCSTWLPTVRCMRSKGVGADDGAHRRPGTMARMLLTGINSFSLLKLADFGCKVNYEVTSRNIHDKPIAYTALLAAGSNYLLFVIYHNSTFETITPI